MEPIRVVLADDHTLVRSGIRALLERFDDVEMVGEAANGREASSSSRSIDPTSY